MTTAIDQCCDAPGDPSSGYDIHFAVEHLDGQLGMSAKDWLAYYDDGYHRDAPVAPAPDKEIVLATFAPRPVVYDVYPSRPAADDARARKGLEQYQPMTWAEYEAGQRAHYLADPLKEVSAERWREMLNVLPPRAWEHGDGVERFMMDEAEAGTIRRQLAQCGGRFFERLVDGADRSTWITGEQCDAVPRGFAAREARRAGETGQAGGRS